MHNHSIESEKQGITKYLPLLIITVFSFILSLLVMKSSDELMYRSMGFFLCFFSLFKWIDVKGFMEGFKEYDLMSRAFPPYLYVYPVLESILGFLYVGVIAVNIANFILISVMAINAISVIFALIKKKKIDCACLGTVIKLPLTVVSLYEIFLMLVMAFIMIRK
jgi:hypothetical protein